MGLDMYLYLRERKYESNFEEGVGLYPKELEKFERDIFTRNFRSVSIDKKYQVGYWRKVNAIHKYFVDVCADGEDNCREVLVSVEDAERLIKLCESVLADHEKAEYLLPTCEGFFFGGTEYDDWYFNELDYTRQLLKEVIEFVKSHDDYDIVYRASW